MKSPYLTINTPLDPDVPRERKFYVQNLIGEEGLCSEFEYRLSISSLERLKENEIERLIGQTVTVSIGHRNQKDRVEYRYINGLVYQLVELGMSRSPLQPDIWQYELVVGSWIKQLQQTMDCRIFQKNNNTNLSIVQDLLRELGFRDIEVNVKSKLPNRDYVVQYNESVFAFIFRLLQEDGLIWRYAHTEDKHSLQIHDDSMNLPKLQTECWGPEERVNSFCKEGSHIIVKQNLVASYDWANPPVKNISDNTSLDKANRVNYMYPGKFIKREEGEGKAQRMSQAMKSQSLVYSGDSSIRNLSAGSSFELSAPVLKDIHGKSFLIKSLKIEATDTGYKNKFVVIPTNQHYFQPEEELIRKPKISGSQTAFVVGEGGPGKIYTDKFGRVKVRFHWDHLSDKDDSHTSAFIRVAVPAAGANRGFVFTPRIGEEVVVNFEDGDPELPIIVGSVYSPNNSPSINPGSKPFTSIIKSDGASDSNQITFDDKPGSENLNLNAKKDMKIDVGGDLTIDVVDDVKITAKSVTIKVAKDVTIDAGGNIINMSMATINNLAGAAITNTAIGGIINMAGGIVKNTAGGMISNTAILSVANTSALGIQQKAKGIIANTAVGAVLNTGSEVVNDGTLAVANTSNLAILNSASGDIKNSALLKKDKITAVSQTEADSYNVKGMTKIN